MDNKVLYQSYSWLVQGTDISQREEHDISLEPALVHGFPYSNEEIFWHIMI